MSLHPIVLQIIHRTIKDVQVHTPLYAWHYTIVGMLPKLPGALIRKHIDVVVGYPEGIGIKLWRVEITHPILIGGVDDGLHAIVQFQAAKEKLEIGL